MIDVDGIEKKINAGSGYTAREIYSRVVEILQSASMMATEFPFTHHLAGNRQFVTLREGWQVVGMQFPERLYQP